MADVKRTSMNLDRELIREAQRILGTATATDTVHASLRETIEADRRTGLSDGFWEAMANLDVEAMRDVDPWNDVDW